MNWADTFDKTEAKKDEEYAAIAEGTYTAYVDQFKIDETKTPARLSITWKITDDLAKNRNVFANYNLNEVGIPFLKKDLNTLGVADVTARTLTQKLDALIGTKAEVYVKPKAKDGKTYYSVYVNEKIDSSFNADEEIPF